MRLLKKTHPGIEYQISLNEGELVALIKVLANASLARSPECLIDMCRWFEGVRDGAVHVGDVS